MYLFLLPVWASKASYLFEQYPVERHLNPPVRKQQSGTEKEKTKVDKDASFKNAKVLKMT